MRALVLLALAAAAPLQAESRDRWNCNASAQIDTHVWAYLETLLSEPGAVRRHLDFYVSWAQQPGYMAEQQYVWVGIPVDATRLWKPDRIYFGLAGDRTDEQGLVLFSSAAVPRIDMPADRLVRSLRPTFNVTAVTIEDASLRTRLWEGGGWTAAHIDRQGNPLGQGALLLPTEAAIQPVFARLRAEVERRAADPDRYCRIIPEPTRQELEERQVDWGQRISRPNLESVAPIPVAPPPARPPR